MGRIEKTVFISYRRDDSQHAAGRVHDRLSGEFGQDLLLMDVDAIPLGSNFSKILRAEVAKCDVLLAVIGERWANITDERGVAAMPGGVAVPVPVTLASIVPAELDWTRRGTTPRFRWSSSPASGIRSATPRCHSGRFDRRRACGARRSGQG